MKQTIEQYIAAEMDGKIVRKSNSPLLGILVLAVGIGLLVLMRTTALPDSVMALCLTFGLIGIVVGLVLTGICLTGAMSHYVYLPSGSRMKDKKIYLGADEYRYCLDAFATGEMKRLSTLIPVVSSNSVLRVLAANDKSIALVQAGRYDTGHLEPETDVVFLQGADLGTLL